MKIVIVGSGRVGNVLVKTIIEEGHDVVVIDKNASTISQITDKYDCNGIVGNGATVKVLNQAGIKSAKLLIAVTELDEVNIMCSLLAKKLGCRHTIARVRQHEFLDEIDYLHREIGVDMVVNPELNTANKITRLLKFPNAFKIEAFADGNINLVEIPIKEGNPLIGKALKEISTITKANITVCAAKRGKEVVIPKGDYIFQNGDIINLVAKHNDLSTFFFSIGLDKKTIKDVMIIGGGMIGFYLASLLNLMNVKTKIIESNKDRCLELDSLLPKTSVVFGDGTNSMLLKNEGLNKTDAVISLAGNDETNLVVSMFAKSNGVEKIITEISNIAFAEMLQEVNLRDTISPEYVTIDEVIRYVRGISKSTNEIKTLYHITDHNVEVLEFDCSPDFIGINTPLKDLKIKENIIVGCIASGREIIIPNGLTEIRPHDSVIIVSKTHINNLKDILA